MHLTAEPLLPITPRSVPHRFLRGIVRRPIRGLSPASAVVVVAAALGLTFEIDRVTASAPLQHLYYVPIIIGAIALGWPGGLSASAAAIVLYHCANPVLLTFRYEEADVVQMALFLAVAVIAAKLTADASRMRALAMTDDLTGLHNLRSFEATLSETIPQMRQEGGDLSLLVLDVDRLKSLNDAHGHLTGAEAVRAVGHTIAECIPTQAIGCRYGGDEFVIAIPRCSETEARKVADRIRRSVQVMEPVLAGVPFPVRTLSVSVGVTCCRFGAGVRPMPDGEIGEQLFRDADRMLYVAKARGRNRVDVA